MSKIIIGRYIPGDSILYKLDPRGKLLVSILFIFIIFLANNWLTYVIITLFTLIAIFSTKLKAKSFLGRS